MTDRQCERPVVLLFALEREWCVLRRRLQRLTRIRHSPCRAFTAQFLDCPVLIVESGVGTSRTATALDWSCRFAHPALVINSGYSGALCDGLEIGDVVAASEILNARQGKLLVPLSPWGRGVRGEGANSTENSCPLTSGPSPPRGEGGTHIRPGRILCTDAMIGDPAQKRKLGLQHRAIAVDMESAAAAAFCTERNIPFACLRVISDTIETRLSPRLINLLSGGQASAWKIVAALCRSPGLLPELLRLGRDTRFASERLACEIEQVLRRSVVERPPQGCLPTR